MLEIKNFKIMGNRIMVEFIDGSSADMECSLDNMNKLNQLYKLQTNDKLKQKETLINKFNKNRKFARKCPLIVMGLLISMFIAGGIGVYLAVKGIIITEQVVFPILVLGLASLPFVKYMDDLTCLRCSIDYINEIEENKLQLEEYIKTLEKNGKIEMENNNNLEKLLSEEISNYKDKKIDKPKEYLKK